MKIEICLPIKNEEEIIKENIESLIFFIECLELDVNWVINAVINNSNDDSYKIAKEISDRHPDLIKCTLLSKPGKARAIKTAWSTSDADVLMFMDIDFAVPLDFLPKLIIPIINNEADLVIGSRFLSKSIINRSWQRLLISKVYIYLSQIILGHKQTDVQCGFKAIKNESFQEIELNLKDNYWFLDTELIMLASYKGFRIKEIAVNWQERVSRIKKSNINVVRDTFSFLLNLIKYKLYIKSLKSKKK